MLNTFKFRLKIQIGKNFEKKNKNNFFISRN